MAHAHGGQNIRLIWTELDFVDFLGEGLGFEHDLFVPPVPDDQEVIGSVADGRDGIAVDGVDNMGVGLFGALLENAVESLVGEVVDVDIGPVPLFGDRDEVSAGVHGDAADSAPVPRMSYFLLFGF